ncbi:MAG: T9SS type A sorting domain-containing protein [Saprospiraceae bacterium]
MTKRLLTFALSCLLSRFLFAENIRPALALPAQATHVRAGQGSSNTLKTNVFASHGSVAVPACSSHIEPDPIEFASNATLWLAPNPATSFLIVSLRFDAETNATIEILDLMGRPLQRELHCLREGSVTFSVADLPKGVFLVRVSEGGQVKWTRRFQKV